MHSHSPSQKTLTPPSTVALVQRALTPLALLVSAPFRSLSHAAPVDQAGGVSKTRDIWIDNGRLYLEVRVAADVDLTTHFKALCLASGQKITIHGERIVRWGALEGGAA